MAQSRRCNVPVKHGDVLNAYVIADQLDNLDIYMPFSSGMTVYDEVLKIQSHKSKKSCNLVEGVALGVESSRSIMEQVTSQETVRAGFQQCTAYICLYVKRQESDFTVAGFYVDDLLVTATSTALVSTFFEGLSSLEIKDLGAVSNFLGLRIVLNNEDGYK